MARTATTRGDQALKVREWVTTGRGRQLRIAANMTLADVAHDCEVNPSAVLHWERGTRTPQGRNVRAYYRVLAKLEALIGDRVATSP